MTVRRRRVPTTILKKSLVGGQSSSSPEEEDDLSSSIPCYYCFACGRAAPAGERTPCLCLSDSAGNGSTLSTVPKLLLRLHTKRDAEIYNREQAEGTKAIEIAKMICSRSATPSDYGRREDAL